MATVVFLPWAAPAAAQDAVAQCSQIEDAAERLACYDRAAKRALPPADEQPQLEEETIVESASRAAPSRNATPPPQAAKDAPVVEAVEKDKAERPSRWRRWFTRDEKRADGAGGETEQQSAPPTAEIVRLKELMRGNFQITLDNGEVWRENEYEPNTTYAVGDRVTIKPALMGTHALRNERTRQSVRVRRVR